MLAHSQRSRTARPPPEAGPSQPASAPARSRDPASPDDHQPAGGEPRPGAGPTRPHHGLNRRAARSDADHRPTPRSEPPWPPRPYEPAEPRPSSDPTDPN